MATRRKMSPAQKRAFLKRMAAGRAKKRRTTTRRRKRNPIMTTQTRQTNPRRRRRAPARRRSPARRRRRNPTSIVGVPVIPAAYEAAGAAAGAYFGGAATNFVSSRLVGRLPVNMQGVGFSLAGLGMIILGKYAKRKLGSTKVPVDTIGLALAVPMFLRAFEQWGIPGFGMGVTLPAVNADTGNVENVTVSNGMGGSIAVGQLPGMGGTINRGSMPGMAGSLYPRMGMGRSTTLQRVH